MQRRDGDVGAGVGVVDRVDVVALDEHLAGVELPAEHRVDDAADRGGLLARGRLQEVVAHGIPVVHRLLGTEVHDHRLGADRQGAREVVVLDGRLQVHEHLAGLVVGLDEVGLVVDPRDAAPAAAVEGLHVHRVAELVGDRLEVEGLVVLRRRVGPADVVDGVLVGHEPRLGDLEPQAHQGDVGAVLLHRLEGEGAVEQVGVVHQRGLLEPLARVVVPVGEAVDDELGAHRLAQVERLDGEALARQLVGDAVVGRDRSDEREQRLEGGGPVLLGPEQQPDEVRPGRRGAAGWSCCAVSVIVLLLPSGVGSSTAILAGTRHLSPVSWCVGRAGRAGRGSKAACHERQSCRPGTSAKARRDRSRRGSAPSAGCWRGCPRRPRTS